MRPSARSPLTSCKNLSTEKRCWLEVIHKLSMGMHLILNHLDFYVPKVLDWFSVPLLITAVINMND
jgi:hypothetical protein